MTQTKIMVLASMHQFHKEHPSFDYETLFQVVEEFKPDHVGVEIRPEDIGADEGYLARNYPFEMIKLSQVYSDRCFGFDWLGMEIAGQRIPDNYWKEISLYKKLERELSDDETIASGDVDRFFEQQMDILPTATPASLVDGRYGAATKSYYQAVEAMLRGSKYELIFEFRRARDYEIGQNIINFVRSHPGSRIVLVMGANHHVYAMETLSTAFTSKDVVYEMPA